MRLGGRLYTHTRELGTATSNFFVYFVVYALHRPTNADFLMRRISHFDSRASVPEDMPVAKIKWGL